MGGESPVAAFVSLGSNVVVCVCVCWVRLGKKGFVSLGRRGDNWFNRVGRSVGEEGGVTSYATG